MDNWTRLWTRIYIYLRWGVSIKNNFLLNIIIILNIFLVMYFIYQIYKKFIKYSLNKINKFIYFVQLLY